MRVRSPLRHVRFLAATTVSALSLAALTSASSAPLSTVSVTDVAMAAPAPASPTAAVEPYAPREGQRVCDPRERPGVQAFRDLVLAEYPDSWDGGIVRDCAVGGRSEHKEGRAWDWMLDAGDPDDAAAAAEVLGWLLASDEAGEPHALARRLGLAYVIWDGRIWTATEPGAWRPYRGVSPHTDHVHFSFSHAGAAKETSFWSGEWEPAVGASYPATTGEDPQVRAAAWMSGATTASAG